MPQYYQTMLIPSWVLFSMCVKFIYSMISYTSISTTLLFYFTPYLSLSFEFNIESMSLMTLNNAIQIHHWLIIISTLFRGIHKPLSFLWISLPLHLFFLVVCPYFVHISQSLPFHFHPYHVIGCAPSWYYHPHQLQVQPEPFLEVVN